MKSPPVHRLLRLLFGAALLLPATRAQAAGETFSWGGSLRTLNLAGEAAPAGLFPAYRLSSTRLRLETAWQPRPSWSVEGALDQQLLGTDPPGSIPLPGRGVNRRVALDHTWNAGERWAGRLQVDRLSAAWSGTGVDLVLGRQAIGFGRIVVYSPLDIVAPFPPEALDTDVRPGVDALRATAHYGLDGQLGAVAVFGDRPRHNTYLLTWADNRAGLDLLALAGTLRERPMAGFGLAGSLGTIGIKGEAALYRGARVGESDGDRREQFAIAALESWYRFAGGVTLLGEYLYNGPGSDDPADYPAVARSAPLAEGVTALLGRHYLIVAPGCEPHPLVTLNGLLIWNLRDDSWLLRPTVTFNLADNLSLELFWSLTAGPAAQPAAAPLPPRPRSEFGSRGGSGGCFLKWFF